MSELFDRIREEKNIRPRIWNKIADYILSNATEIPKMKIDELRREAGVSDGSIINFVRSLGCEGFGHFKVLVAQANGGLYDRFTLEKGDCSSLDRIVSETKIAIDDAAEYIDRSAITAIAELIINSKGRIVLFGKETSSLVAEIFSGYLLLLGIPCIVASESRQSQLLAGALNTDDVVIAISYSGATQQIVSGIKTAKQSGATTACITSFAGSELAVLSDFRIIIPSKEAIKGDFPVISRITQLMVCNAICSEIASLKDIEKR